MSKHLLKVLVAIAAVGIAVPFAGDDLIESRTAPPLSS